MSVWRTLRSSHRAQFKAYRNQSALKRMEAKAELEGLTTFNHALYPRIRTTRICNDLMTHLVAACLCTGI